MTCPLCRGELIKRKGRFGEFMGCSRLTKLKPFHAVPSGTDRYMITAQFQNGEDPFRMPVLYTESDFNLDGITAKELAEYVAERMNEVRG